MPVADNTPGNIFESIRFITGNCIIIFQCKVEKILKRFLRITFGITFAAEFHPLPIFFIRFNIMRMRLYNLGMSFSIKPGTKPRQSQNENDQYFQCRNCHANRTCNDVFLFGLFCFRNTYNRKNKSDYRRSQQ